MVDALVTIAAEGILKKVLAIATNELVLAWGYKKKLTTICMMMEMIHGKLRDAERQKAKEVVILWLKELKDVVDEADDVLDKIRYEMLRRVVSERDAKPRKVHCFPCLKSISFRIEMGYKIENIRKKLEEISKRAIYLGLQNEQTGLILDSLQEHSDSFLEEYPHIVGRENDALCIMKLLTRSRNEENLTIVPVVGKAGIGKTTLAKLVYNSGKLREGFDIRIWLCVSVKVDVNTLLAMIDKYLNGNRCMGVQTREILIRNLQERLGWRRYLLVLDNVWDEKQEHWDDFRSCMLKVNSHNGNGILVTTRNLEIRTNGVIKDSYALKALSDDQCWLIFKERAFVLGRSPLLELEEIGLAIVKKCCGLPLVVKVIGSMLRYYNDDKEKWVSLRDSKCWDLNGGDIVPTILKLSFDNLPNSNAKLCFAYCSIFKKDTTIQREQLIQLWMALGLIQADEKRNKEIEDVGNDVFQTLVRNYLLQDVGNHGYGYNTHFKMHDSVHDLSLSLSRNESLCLEGSTRDYVHSSQVKHLAVYQPANPDELINTQFGQRISMLFKENRTTRALRTLFFNGIIEKNISFQRFKCLRVLTISWIDVEHKVHDSIGELVHLRYLDFSDSKINFLPESIGNLYNLQTLNLSYCIFLWELPKGMRNLISLRHFMCDGTNLTHHNVGQLTSLRTLSTFVVGRHKGYQIGELGRLKHLRGNLTIQNLQEVGGKEDAAKADLSRKTNLNKIVYHWSIDRGGNRNDKDVLEGLQPHANMKSLEIENFLGDNFPLWVMKMAINIQDKWTPLERLVKITLCGCRNSLNLPTLRNLPLLQNLVLKYMDNLTCLSSFSGQGDDDVTELTKPLSPSLRSLELVGMKSLEKWTDAATNSSTMLSPVLEKLYICDCPKLTLIDEYQSHPLVSLTLHFCKNLESIRSLQGLTSLEDLNIGGCHSLVRIPDLHKHGRSLKSLSIMDCKKMTCLPGGIDSLDFLQRLSLGSFSKDLHCFPRLQGVEKLGKHLRTLCLSGWAHWESIPEQVSQLTALTQLTIMDFGIKEIPIWLTNMSSIRHLSISHCESLAYESVSQKAPREANSVCFKGKILRRQRLNWVY